MHIRMMANRPNMIFLRPPPMEPSRLPQRQRKVSMELRLRMTTGPRSAGHLALVVVRQQKIRGRMTICSITKPLLRASSMTSSLEVCHLPVFFCLAHAKRYFRLVSQHRCHHLCMSCILGRRRPGWWPRLDLPHHDRLWHLL